MLIALNIKYEIMLESFVHNVVRVHFLDTNMQKDVIKNKPILLFRMTEYVLNALNIEYDIMFISLVHNFTRFHFLHANIQKMLRQTYIFYSL